MNLSYLRPSLVGGSEVYVRELLPRLAGIDGNSATVYCWESAASTLEGCGASVVTIARGPFTQRRRLYADNVALAVELHRRPVDVLFSPANFAAPALPARVPQVATIHDLQHVHLPKHFSLPQLLFRRALFRGTTRRCRALIAVSDYTRQDVIREYRIPPERITTILEGISDAAVPDARTRVAVKAKHALPDAFFYYPAMLAPHKNHMLLLDALQRARKAAGQDLALVLSGNRTEHYPAFERAVRERRLQGSVLHLGFLPREEVWAVMACARALVFPSLFEGFGLPVLEAMKCEVPALVSAATSLPEVAGDAAILLPPDNPGAWAGAMLKVLRDDVQRDLVQRGRVHVRRFSWKRCAAETNEVLRRAAGR